MLRALARYWGRGTNCPPFYPADNCMTSVKRQTRRGRHYDFFDRADLLFEKRQRHLPHVRSSNPPWQRVEKLDTLRRRSGACRIRRHRHVIVQTVLKVFLLLTQSVASFQGAQMLSERPLRRTGTRQSHASRVGPRTSKRSNESNHTLICPMEYICQKKIQEMEAN